MAWGDINDVWVSGTGEQLSKTLELMISVRKIRKGEVRATSVPPKHSLELMLGMSEHFLGSIPVPVLCPGFFLSSRPEAAASQSCDLWGVQGFLYPASLPQSVV